METEILVRAGISNGSSGLNNRDQRPRLSRWIEEGAMRLITDVLRDIRKGRVVDAASDKLAEVVRGVMDTEKAGSLTITISIKPRAKGDNCLLIQAKIDGKIPQADLPDALFFANLDGDLLRDDPTQTRMFADAGEVIDPKTGEIRESKGA
jgi:hypothetical protein